MRLRLKFIETCLLLLLAVAGLLVAGFFHSDVHHFAEGSKLEERARVIQLILALYSAFLVALAGVSFTAIRSQQMTLMRRSIQFLSAIPGEAKRFTLWLSENANIKPMILWIGSITGLGLAIRSYFMALPMRYDESSTFLSYVNRPLDSLFRYEVPNNHVLHTLLVKLSVVIFGTDPVAIRLPALFAGVCAIPATLCLARLLGKGKGGLLASATVAGFPYLVFYDTMARGYSLVVLLSLLLAITGLYFVSNPSFAATLLVSLLASLGLLTMPSFLFSLSGIYLWIAVLLLIRTKTLSQVIRYFVLPCGLTTGLITFVFYTPVIIHSNGVHNIVNNRYVTGLPWAQFLTLLPNHILETIAAMRQDLPWLLILCALSLAAIGVLDIALKRRFEPLLLYVSLLVSSAVVLFLKHAIPYDRTWIYWIPFLCILANLGFTAHSGRWAEPLKLRVRMAILGLLSIWGVHLMSGGGIPSYLGSFPEAPVIVDVYSKERHPGDILVSQCPADNVLSYYLFKKGIPEDAAPSNASAKREFFVVEKGWYSIEALTRQPVTKLLDMDGASLYVREVTKD